jgi:tripartite-type tricarboxylate transporter receptor subunit TctC
MKTVLVRKLIVAAGLAAAALSASAQEYPSKIITMAMPYAPGGPGDTITRLFASTMQKSLGQQIVVDNTAGASGTIGTAKVARSAPDGYNLLMIHISHATGPMLIKNLSYDPVKDFEPIGLATVGPMVLVARKDFPPVGTQAFVDYVKKNGDKLSMGNAGAGSASHLCSLLFMETLGIKPTLVPYKGTGPALNDLMGGQIDLLCDQTTGTIPAIKGDRVKAYAVAGSKRIDSLPDLPSLTEVGVKGFDISIWFGLYAPKGTPKPIVDKLSAALAKAVVDPTVKERLAGIGSAPVTPDLATPAKLREHLQNEINTLTPLIKSAGLYVN